MTPLLLLPSALAATLEVGPSGDYSTLSAAIDAASSGDTLDIEAGTYAECVSLGGKDLTLSGAGSGATVLDGAGCAVGLSAESGERLSLRALALTAPLGTAVVIRGGEADLDDVLIFDSGATTLSGGGLRVTDASLSVTDSVFTGNTASAGGHLYLGSGASATITGGALRGGAAGDGAAIYAASGALLVWLQGATIEDNLAYTRGGGLYAAEGVAVESLDAAWTSNGAGSLGGAVYAAGDLAMTGDRLSLNDATSAGAVYATGTTVSLTGLEVSRNTGGSGATLATIALIGATDAQIVDCGFADNTGTALGLSGVEDARISGGRFTGNGGATRYGGGVAASQVSALLIEDTDFEANFASVAGGGLDARGGDSATLLQIVDSRFDANTAHQGAGLCSYNVAVEITGSGFYDNVAEDGGGGLLAYRDEWEGEGARPPKTTVSVSDSEFFDNLAGAAGAGIDVYELDGFTVEHTDFQRNAVVDAPDGYGGAIAHDAGDLEIHGSRFCANAAPLGGALYYWTTDLIVQNSVFVENVATVQGGAIQGSDCVQSFTNNTLVGNSAPLGGALGSFRPCEPDTVYTNSVFAYTVEGWAIYSNLSSALAHAFTYDDWYENGPDHVNSALILDTSADGNLSVDPGFVAYSRDGDCSNDDLTPAEGSPLIDAGDPDILDADGSVSDVGATGGPEGLILTVEEEEDTGDSGGSGDGGDTEETGDSAETGPGDTPSDTPGEDTPGEDKPGEDTACSGCAVGVGAPAGAPLLLGVIAAAARRRRSDKSFKLKLIWRHTRQTP